MALPFIGNNKKKVGRPKGSKNKKKSPNKTPQVDSRSTAEKLGGAIMGAVVKPAKYALTNSLRVMSSELPEIADLANGLNDIRADLANALSREKKDNSVSTTSNTTSGTIDGSKFSQASTALLKNINNSIMKQTSIVSSNFDRVNAKLDGLDDIHAELRTLTGITAKVWDVQSKALYDARSRNRKFAMKRSSERLEGQLKSTDNQTYAENLAAVKKQNVPANQNNIQPPEQKGLLGALGGIGSTIASGLGGLTTGIFGKQIGGIINSLAKSVGSLTKNVAKIATSGTGTGILGGARNLVAKTPGVGALYSAGKGVWETGKAAMDIDWADFADRMKEGWKKGGLSLIKSFITDDVVKTLAEAFSGGVYDALKDIVKMTGDTVKTVFGVISQAIGGEEMRKNVDNFFDNTYKALDTFWGKVEKLTENETLNRAAYVVSGGARDEFLANKLIDDAYAKAGKIRPKDNTNIGATSQTQQQAQRLQAQQNKKRDFDSTAQVNALNANSSAPVRTSNNTSNTTTNQSTTNISMGNSDRMNYKKDTARYSVKP